MFLMDSFQCQSSNSQKQEHSQNRIHLHNQMHSQKQTCSLRNFRAVQFSPIILYWRIYYESRKRCPFSIQHIWIRFLFYHRLKEHFHLDSEHLLRLHGCWEFILPQLLNQRYYRFISIFYDVLPFLCLHAHVVYHRNYVISSH